MHDATIPKLLTVKQAAELLQVSTKTIYRWLRANLVKYVRIGKEYRIRQDSLPTCADDELSKKIEPGAPPTSERLKWAKRLAQQGQYVIVAFNPLVEAWILQLARTIYLRPVTRYCGGCLSE